MKKLLIVFVLTVQRQIDNSRGIHSSGFSHLAKWRSQPNLIDWFGFDSVFWNQECTFFQLHFCFTWKMRTLKQMRDESLVTCCPESTKEHRTTENLIRWHVLLAVDEDRKASILHKKGMVFNQIIFQYDSH